MHVCCRFRGFDPASALHSSGDKAQQSATDAADANVDAFSKLAISSPTADDVFIKRFASIPVIISKAQVSLS
jgi:hypothetical protein